MVTFKSDSCLKYVLLRCIYNHTAQQNVCDIQI